MVVRLKLNLAELRYQGWREPRFRQLRQAEPTYGYVGAPSRSFMCAGRDEPSQQQVTRLCRVKVIPDHGTGSGRHGAKQGRGGVPCESRGRDMSPRYPLTRAARSDSARRAEKPCPGQRGPWRPALTRSQHGAAARMSGGNQGVWLQSPCFTL